jgi:hypothetical protein
MNSKYGKEGGQIANVLKNSSAMGADNCNICLDVDRYQLVVYIISYSISIISSYTYTLGY